MSVPVLQVLDAGFGVTLQDHGRWGWRRFGVPISGAMDDHAAGWANQLLDNSRAAPVLELLLQGARLAVLQDVWLAITGADTEVNVPLWRTVHARPGDILQFQRNRSGVWNYLAIEGGFEAPVWLGSASTYARGGLGRRLVKGDVLKRSSQSSFSLLRGVAGRAVATSELRNYRAPPPLRVWPGPQWNCFSESDRRAFLAEPWMILPQSDRVGFRLSGVALQARPSDLISEPVLVGSIQVPENGTPIVLMRDGPTVGGYPKLGLIDPNDLGWLAQCRPGQQVRFRFVS